MPATGVAAMPILAAYLLGSLSGSLLLGKLRGVDIRTQGSGNAGGTNAFRTQGAMFALGAVAIDIGKGALAAWLALRFADAGSVAWLPTPPHSPQRSATSGRSGTASAAARARPR